MAESWEGRAAGGRGRPDLPLGLALPVQEQGHSLRGDGILRKVDPSFPGKSGWWWGSVLQAGGCCGERGRCGVETPGPF